MKTIWATVQSWMVPPEPAPKKVRKQWKRGPRGPMKSHAEYTMEQAMRDIDTGAAKRKKRETN
jgi:hypothetical protein